MARRGGTALAAGVVSAAMLVFAAALLTLPGMAALGCSSSSSTTTQPGGGGEESTGVVSVTTTATTAPGRLPGNGAAEPGSSGAPDSPRTSLVGDSAASTSPPTTVFAVIGDYGMDDQNEAAVAELVSSWQPTYIITTGDDYYGPAGGKGTGKYDESTGAYYGEWLKDITTTGKRCPKGLAPVNAFFPALGNHDYTSASPGPKTYLKYFKLPGDGFRNTSGNERYYDFVEGPVHFFVLNSNPEEPDGTSSSSRQAVWLKKQLAASTSVWNVVYDHHPPFSSDLLHGSVPYMQWPFAAWGADAVLSGHAHAYERLEREGVAYFVNGLGGAARYGFGFPVPGSQVRYNSDWGAQKVTVRADGLVFEFWNVAGELIDSYTVPAKG